MLFQYRILLLQANEKKARKVAEDKASRPECSSQCKQRRQQMDEEQKRLRGDLKQTEEAKQLAVEHGRKVEQEVSSQTISLFGKSLRS